MLWLGCQPMRPRKNTADNGSNQAEFLQIGPKVERVLLALAAGYFVVFVNFWGAVFSQATNHSEGEDCVYRRQATENNDRPAQLGRQIQTGSGRTGSGWTGADRTGQCPTFPCSHSRSTPFIATQVASQIVETWNWQEPCRVIASAIEPTCATWLVARQLPVIGIETIQKTSAK